MDGSRRIRSPGWSLIYKNRRVLRLDLAAGLPAPTVERESIQDSRSKLAAPSLTGKVSRRGKDFPSIPEAGGDSFPPGDSPDLDRRIQVFLSTCVVPAGGLSLKVFS